MNANIVTRTGTIYMLTSPSGKRYVGQTRRPVNVRIAAHASQKGCCAIHAAIKKYGLSAFKVDLLCVGVPISQLNWYEGFCVALFGTLHPVGYNLGPGGNAAITTSEVSRKRRSVSLRKAFSTLEARARRSVRSKANYASPGALDRRSARSRALWSAPGARERWVAHMRETFNSPEVRAQRASLTANSWRDPEIRARRTAALAASWVLRKKGKTNEARD